MKLCMKEGNGVCINCPRNLPNSWGDICRYDAEVLLDCFNAIVNTEWTYEQEQVFADFGVMKNEVIE